MFDTFRRHLRKDEALAAIVVAETTNKNRAAYDFLAQSSIKSEMDKVGYRYVGTRGGGADATSGKAYRVKQGRLCQSRRVSR